MLETCLTDSRYRHVTPPVHLLYPFSISPASFSSIGSKLRKLRGGERPLSLTLRSKGFGQLSNDFLAPSNIQILLKFHVRRFFDKYFRKLK